MNTNGLSDSLHADFAVNLGHTEWVQCLAADRGAAEWLQH